MRKSSKILLGAAAVVVVAGSAAWLAGRGRRAGVAIQAGEVVRKEIVSTVLANGKLQPRNKVDISANIAGQIVNLAIREGDEVRKDDFLLQIDQVQYRASTRSSEANLQSLLHDRDVARANLEQASYDYEKAEQSFASQLIPEAELQRARSSFEAGEASLQAAEGRVEQARASLEGARDELDKTTIRSPIDGVVTSLPVHEGEVAVIGTMNNPGTVLMTVSDLSLIDADLAVDETDLPRLAVGQKAALTIEAYPDHEFEGAVREVGSSPIRPGSDAATRTGTTTTEAIDFEVKVTVLAPPAEVRPGFSVTAEIETGRATNVPVVPIQALVSREAPRPEGSTATAGRGAVEEGVYVIEDGHARFVRVGTGLTGALEIEVTEGVGEGDEIIVGPFRALRELTDGARVRVATEGVADSGSGE
jgi:HlyD family secretion protein